MSIGELLAKTWDRRRLPGAPQQKHPNPGPSPTSVPKSPPGTGPPSPPGVKSPSPSDAGVRLPDAASDAPTEATATPEAATLSLSSPLGSLDLPGWWDDSTNDIRVGVRSGTGGRSVVLELGPPGLGTVSVVLTFYADSVSAQITVDDDDVAHKMTEWLPQLRLSLAELFRVDEIRIIHRPETIAHDLNAAKTSRIQSATRTRTGAPSPQQKPGAQIVDRRTFDRSV